MEEELKITLNSFYIFNPLLGCKEGEEDKKILFYYPAKTDVTTQVKNVGLSEAIIKFTENFISKEECKSVHMLKTRRYFYHPEGDCWIVMTINVPCISSKNGLKDSSYRSENIHDDVYHSLVKQAYEMYKLFVGPFSSFLNSDQNGVQILKTKLQQFFTRYLPVLKIANCDIIDVFEGMQFLPLDKKTYLHAQSFMNLFQSTFGDEIHYAMFLVRQHLVWSNIEGESLRTIYRYLTTNLLSSFINNSNTNDASEGSFTHDTTVSPEITIISDSSLGRFITCPPFYSNSSNVTMGKVPKLFIKCGDKNIVYQLVVYNVLSSFICIFIPETTELSMDLLKHLENFFKLKMIAFSSELCLQVDKKRSTAKNVSNSGNSFSYIYFNKLNLAQKNTIRNNKSFVTPEILSVLNDVCFDKKRSDSAIGETILKTYDDHWVVGQFCNEREFYVVTQQKNTTLIEINDEMKKICEKQLKSIFFHI
ncbi:vacuolar fusion protein CCZ1 homolog [Planococcus citri]|uniref:vacuolar fusion protein CCZ1 homolog n=1 Tax=Planococcus citri TaxID=170843 RepID=UPI0031F90232